MISNVVLVAGTVVIIWVSRRSFLHPMSHGFARFFAFEAIFALIVINAPYWLRRPLGAQQVVSWFLLAASIVLVVSGVTLLRRFGKARPTTHESSAFDWENTANLVTSGIYGHVRHPMYSSLLFLAWGAFLKSVSVGTLVLAAIATVALTATAKVEERENLARFGEEYRTYMKRSRLFIPFVL